MNVRLVGLAGGSGSGKTTFGRALAQRFAETDCALIYQDNYYIDQSARFDGDGGSVNFDHPDSLDFELLAAHLAALKRGEAVEIPIYDFATHRRLQATIHQPACRLILVDGILIFHPQVLRTLFDELVFFDAPEELRFQRRLARDVRDRGRTPEGVLAQFDKHVKPMHDRFVEPSKEFADVVIKDVGESAAVLEEFTSRYRALMGF